jgi:endonuclease/exonuclease/phosphatase (EEP) superfamily protein YafD
MIVQDTASGDRRRQRLRRLRLARLAALGCVGVLMLPLLFRLLPETGETVESPAVSALLWLLDLAAHWQWLFAIGLVVLCVAIGLAAHRDRRWWALVPLAAAPLWTASPVLPDAGGRATPELTVVVANVHAGNRDPRPLLDWLATAPADVVVLLELSPAYAEALAGAAPDYPHRELLPDDSPFGIGLLSRRPLAGFETHASADDIPFLLAMLDTPQGQARLIAVHPMPPLQPHWRRERDLLLEVAARDSRELPTLVVGDLNATPWSTALLSPRTRDLRRTTGFAPTWRPFGGRWFGLPIDHVLASPHWQRVHAERGPDIGSDHLPLRVALRGIP